MRFLLPNSNLSSQNQRKPESFWFHETAIPSRHTQTNFKSVLFSLMKSSNTNHINGVIQELLLFKIFHTCWDRQIIESFKSNFSPYVHRKAINNQHYDGFLKPGSFNIFEEKKFRVLTDPVGGVKVNFPFLGRMFIQWVFFVWVFTLFLQNQNF